MIAEPPDLTVTRIFDAPRALVYRSFTDPEQLAEWWGPRGHSLLRSEMASDVRPGGFQRWTEVAVDDPDLRVHVAIDLTNVSDGALLEGMMHVAGSVQESFKTRFRIEFHDEPDGRTRLEIRQWLPSHLSGPTNLGWLEAFEKLDVVLRKLQTIITNTNK